MGAFLLDEKFNRAQMVAVGLAALAVATDRRRWRPALGVVGFGVVLCLYGYLRKTLPIGPSQGFFLEVLILCMPALGYIFWLQMPAKAISCRQSPGHRAPAALRAGHRDAAPALCLRREAVALSTIGIMQYIGRSMVLLIAVFVFGEPFGGVRAVAFGLIWVALAIYTWSMFWDRWNWLIQGSSAFRSEGIGFMSAAHILSMTAASPGDGAAAPAETRERLQPPLPALSTTSGFTRCDVWMKPSAFM